MIWYNIIQGRSKTLRVCCYRKVARHEAELLLLHWSWLFNYNTMFQSALFLSYHRKLTTFFVLCLYFQLKLPNKLVLVLTYVITAKNNHSLTSFSFFLSIFKLIRKKKKQFVRLLKKSFILKTFLWWKMYCYK